MNKIGKAKLEACFMVPAERIPLPCRYNTLFLTADTSHMGKAKNELYLQTLFRMDIVCREK